MPKACSLNQNIVMKLIMFRFDNSCMNLVLDLFEVVDRRAKLVVGEQSDELPVTTSGMCLRIYVSLLRQNYYCSISNNYFELDYPQ